MNFFYDVKSQYVHSTWTPNLFCFFFRKKKISENLIEPALILVSPNDSGG